MIGRSLICILGALVSVAVAQLPPVGPQCNIDSASECLVNLTDRDLVSAFISQGFLGKITNHTRLCSEVTDDVVRCFQRKSLGCRMDQTLSWDSLYATFLFMCGIGSEGYGLHNQCLNSVDVSGGTKACVQTMTDGVNRMTGLFTPEQQLLQYCGLIDESKSCLQMAVGAHCSQDAAIYMGDLTDASYWPLTDFLQCPQPTPSPSLLDTTTVDIPAGAGHTAQIDTCDIMNAAGCLANVTDSSIMFGFAEGKAIVTHIPNLTEVCRAFTADIDTCVAGSLTGCPRQESLGLEVTYATYKFLCQTGKDGYEIHKSCFVQPNTKDGDQACAVDMGRKVQDLIVTGDPLGAGSGIFCKIISEGQDCLTGNAATFCSGQAAHYMDELTNAMFAPLVEFLGCPVRKTSMPPTTTSPSTPAVTTEQITQSTTHTVTTHKPTTTTSATQTVTTHAPTSTTSATQTVTTHAPTSTTSATQNVTTPTLTTTTSATQTMTTPTPTSTTFATQTATTHAPTSTTSATQTVTTPTPTTTTSATKTVTTPTPTSTTSAKQAAGISCLDTQFRCGNGRCIPITWNCDGDNDCGDDSDEFGCATAKCSQDAFMCSDDRCIPASWRCDGETDCGDFSDESNCSESEIGETQTTTVPTKSTATTASTTTVKTTPHQTTTPEVTTTAVPVTSTPTSTTITTTVAMTSSTTSGVAATRDPACAKCHARGAWRHDRFMQTWCDFNCREGFCPAAVCYCGCPEPERVMVCQAVGAFRGTLGINEWCTTNCRSGEFCPDNVCQCRYVVLDQ